ncbi:nitroreductase/quinone reductase family protein [Saccharothrix coeruleofusca]|uniref:Cation-binding protein n=1 Tax=Saccharothrix coeruleofusca TaxID=33919 RepID=A0A918EEE1_9PSEU|nr:nitroreductase/quinone reductase family protein [Saccharothrix coeruleofusca]GGP64745.1 cation-binding protein [Saccharothrix coeruleofusca]
MPEDFNQKVIEEFRANRGRVGGYFEGARLLLLTTTGARSGKRHTVPLGYLPDGDRVLVIGSAGGAPRHPAWFHNLVADPRATVEDGVFTYEAQAEVLAGEERDRVFARAVEFDPGWGEYQARTTRVLPVVALKQVGGGPPAFGSWAEAVKGVHEAFRRELSLIREEITRSGPGLGAQLRINCLTLCQGLRNHHTGEDVALFPFIADRYPEVKPVLDRLALEHERIAALLADLHRVTSEGDTGPEALRVEVERLAGELERHLAYEEEQLVPLLEVG